MTTPAPAPAPNVKRNAIIGGVLALVAVIAAAVALSVGDSTAKQIDKASGLNNAASAPALPALKAADWIQSPPLTPASLKGKVVLIDFWDASCINCRRTFPFLGKLYATYAMQGLVIIGVHSPEFAFEKSASYVTSEAKALGVTWPVANDPDMTIWNEFGNQYWPAEYLVDRTGKVRWLHTGEGDDDLIEQNVRALLDVGGSAGTAHVGDVVTSQIPATNGEQETPETYLGAERGASYIPGGVVATGKTVTRNDKSPVLNAVSLDGTFTGSDEFVTLQPGATVKLNYISRDAYVILAPHTAGTTPTVTVTKDGAPVPANLAGPSLEDSTVHVDKQDLYHIVTGPTGSTSTGVLALTAGSQPVDIYTFTFGA